MEITKVIKGHTIRVDDEVWGWLGRLPGSVNEGLRALMAAPSGDPNAQVNRWFRETWARLEEIERIVSEGRGTVPPGLIQVANPAVPRSSGFWIQCRHCGEQGEGPTKFATICFSCKSDGHSNQPSDCPICTAGSAI